MFVGRFREAGYTDTSQLLKRIFQPADSWEKTTGSAVMNGPKINEAFEDDIYVSDDGKRPEDGVKLTEL